MPSKPDTVSRIEQINEATIYYHRMPPLPPTSTSACTAR